MKACVYVDIFESVFVLMCVYVYACDDQRLMAVSAALPESLIVE